MDIFAPDCDAIDCALNAKYEREVTVFETQGLPFTFIAHFCEEHKDDR
jgi:hypothetical protein